MTAADPSPDKTPLRDIFAQAMGVTELQLGFKSAIASNDADALRGYLGEAMRLSPSLPQHMQIRYDTWWKDAAYHGSVACLEVFWEQQKSRRDIAALCREGWHGAVIAGQKDVIEWLCDSQRPQPNCEHAVQLACDAMRNGHASISYPLLQQARALEDGQKKSDLMASFLRACAVAGNADAAREIMEAYFVRPPFHFTVQDDTYQKIVMNAATGGHVETLSVLLESGQAFLTDAHVTQLMIAALDHKKNDAARLLLSCGADPNGMQATPVRYAAVYFAETHAAGFPDVAKDAQAMLAELLSAGGDPEKAKAAVIAAGHPDTPLLVDMVSEMDAAARTAHFARLDGLAVLRQPFGYKPAGRFESGLHQAARYRVLDRLMQRPQGLVLVGGDWSATNAAGQRVADLLVASGHLKDLLSPELWRGRFALLGELLALVPEKAMTPAEKISHLQQVQQALLDEKSRNRGRRLKL